MCVCIVKAFIVLHRFKRGLNCEIERRLPINTQTENGFGLILCPIGFRMVGGIDCLILAGIQTTSKYEIN